MSGRPPRVRPTRPVVLVPPQASSQAQQRPSDRGQVKHRSTMERHENSHPRPGVHAGQNHETPPAVQPQPVQHPPERVRTNRPEALKSQRWLIKEQDASVFRQQAPENLPVKRSSEPRTINRKPVKQEDEQKKNLGEKRDGR